MGAHTPGPWECGTQGNGAVGSVYCDDATGGRVALVYGKGQEYTLFSRATEEANARLIAAAPELLERLQEMVALMPDPELDNDDVQRGYVIAARATLAKATGETK